MFESGSGEHGFAGTEYSAHLKTHILLFVLSKKNPEEQAAALTQLESVEQQRKVRVP